MKNLTMISFYLDEDISSRLKEGLRSIGYDAVTARELGRCHADDATHLLAAARDGRILVTHNRGDYQLLQRAWRGWQIPIRHAGILIVPQCVCSLEELASIIDGLIRSGRSLANDVYSWSLSRNWARCA